MALIYTTNFKARFALSAFLFFVSIVAHAQYENVWAFGRGAGLDFNNGAPVPIKTAITGSGEASASVCDAQGRLLFYTDGTIVWDRSNNVMPHGGNLIPAVQQTAETPTVSTCQGALIVPIPGSVHQYYVFSLTAIESSAAGNLYYSVVDMSLRNGLGDVVTGEMGIPLDNSLSEKMTAVTGSRCDIWLLVHERLRNLFKAYRISESGIDTVPQKTYIGKLYGPLFTGQIVVSPDGNKIALCNIPFLGQPGGDLELFDFDRITGVVSNNLILDKGTSYYGAAFSPDNLKLYGSTTTSVYQFDLAAPDPKNTRDSIAPASFSHLKLAPDDKIYFVTKLRGGALSVINAPNLAGSACDPISDAIILGTSGGPGLPNVVPVITRDTFFTSQAVSAGCFANTNLLTITANDSSGWDYLWNTGRTAPELTVDTPGTYWVSYHTSPCTFHTDTFHVSFPNGVLPDIIMDTACAHTSNGGAYAATYPGDTVTYHYLWRNSTGDTLSTTDTLAHVPSGNYTLQVKTAHCDTMLSFSIPEMDYRVSFQVDTLICQRTMLQFHNTSDPHFSSFRWDFGDGDSSAFPDPEHRYPHAGTYGVRLIGEGRICTDTTHKTITVDSQLSGWFHLQPERICTGETIFFYPDAEDSTIERLHWQFGDGTEMSSGIEHKLQHAYDSAGRLPVTLTTSFRACPDTSYTDTVTVYPLPYIDLGKDTSICLQGAPITLTNLAENRPGKYHYLWNTGDTSKKIQVRHQGEYSLKVSTEPLGCYTKETVRVTKDCYIDIPNAFTPNGDGNNDYFLPRKLLSKGVTGFKMDIYNRWGEKIFSTNNPIGRGWDGRFNGVPQPQGVYVYLIDVVYKNGRSEHYQGNVTLIR